jgi:hypothetical protein
LPKLVAVRTLVAARKWAWVHGVVPSWTQPNLANTNLSRS